MNNTIIILISLVLLAGCASTPPPRSAQSPPATNRPIAPELQAKAAAYEAVCNSDVWMKTSMKIAFPDLDQNISATIEMAKMDSVLITISAMFGISVGKMFATPDEFIMNNNLDNTTYIGQPTSENLMKVAYIDMSYSDLLCALKCAPPRPFGSYRLDTATSAYTYETDTFLEQIYFEGEQMRKLVRTDKLGNELISINYDKYSQVGPHWFASSIWIAFPQANGSINIALTDIQVNRKLRSPMRVAIPKSYEVIDF